MSDIEYINSIDKTISRLSELSKDPVIKQISDIISDITISDKYDYNDILDLDTRIIEYITLSIRLDNLNNR